MSESDQTGQMQASTGAAQTGQTSGGGTPPNSTGAQHTGFRYVEGPGIPQEIVGKTAGEVAQEYAQLYQYALRSLGQQQQAAQPAAPPQHTQPGYPPPQPQYSAPPQVAQGVPVPPTPDEWQMDPGAAYQKQREYDEATRYQPVIGGLQSQLASTNAALLRQNYAADFKKWGPEIIQLMQTIPEGNRTYDAMERVVQVVRSNHIDDLVEERLKAQRAAEPVGDAALRSGAVPTTGQPGPNTVDFNELPQGYREYLEVNRVDQSTLDEFLMGAAGSLYGSSLDERRKGFVEAAKGGDVRTERPVQSDGVGAPTADKTKLQVSEA